jgi:hypothetical protein
MQTRRLALQVWALEWLDLVTLQAATAATLVQHPALGMQQLVTVA